MKKPQLPPRSRRSNRRRWVLLALATAAVVGVVAGTLVLPHITGNASSTAVSTIYATGKNSADGSVAASSDAPGGVKTGTAKPGDRLDWVVPYQNNTGASGYSNVKDVLTNAGTYVPGSLQLPRDLTASGTVAAQYSADGGATWTPTPGATVNGVGYAGQPVPSGTSGDVGIPALNPSPPLSTTGGDGYNAVVYNGQVYAVYHHTRGNAVYCATVKGTACAGWPANGAAQSWSPVAGTPIGQGTPIAGQTAFQNGTWLSGSKLFWLVGIDSTHSVGTACLELAVVPPTSCTYREIGTSTADFGVDAPPIAGMGITASDGLMYVATVIGRNNQIVCINPTNGAGCLIPKTVSTHTLATMGESLPTTSTFGDYVFASFRNAPGGAFQTYCYKVGGGGSLCPGSWPVTSTTTVGYRGPVLGPVLSKTGALTGICTLPNGTGALVSACWSITGAAQQLTVNPYYDRNAGTMIANYNNAATAGGDTFALGTRVYFSGGEFVHCVDFATWSGSGQVPFCDGWKRPANPRHYTVREAPGIAKDCLVADGDGGRITFFNATDGSGCTGSAYVGLVVTPANSYCGSGAAGITGWDRLTLPGIVPTAYEDATITLRDQNSTLIPGFQNVKISGSGWLNISSIPTSVTSINASVTINNVTDSSGVASARVSISWRGSPPEMCFSTIAPDVACDAAAPTMVSNAATAVTTSSAGSDAPGGNTTGAASFAVRAAASQCGLAISKTPTVTSTGPGGRIGYTITVTNTGTQAYSAASFTDDLTDVLKETTYNGDHAATAGTVSYAAPTLSWTGGLAPRAVATITYSVTVKNPLPAGDHSLVNAVISPSPGNNCPAQSADPACTVTVTVVVAEVVWHKVDATAAKNILAGASWTFTPVDAQGRPTGAAIVVDDCTAAPCTGADLDPVGGVFRVGNLGIGTYQLVETRAPVGFRLDSTPIPVSVTSVPTTVSLPDVVNRQLPVPAIPFTGGTSADALTFTGGGLLVIVLGLGVWHLLRRRRRMA